MEAYRAGEKAYGEFAESITVDSEEATMSAEQFKGAMSDLSAVMRDDLTSAQEDYADKIERLRQAYKEAASGTQQQNVLDQIKKETQAYNERANAIMFNIQQQAIMAAAERGQIDYSQASAAISTLATSYGMIDETQKAVIDGTQTLIDRFAETGNIEAFTQGLRDMTQNQYEAVPAINETTGRIVEFANKTELAVESLLKLPPSGTSWDYTLSLNSFAMGFAGGAGGGDSGLGISTTTTTTTSHGGGHDSAKDTRATGGSMGRGWTMVGERGFELISPSGRVYTNAQSRAMMRGGMRPSKRFAVGGDFVTDYGEIFATGTDYGYIPTTPGNIGNTYTPSSSSSSSSASAVVSNIVASAAPAIADIVATNIAAGIQTQIIQQSVQLKLSVDKMTAENKNIVNRLDAILAKVASESGIARAVVGVGNKWNG